MNVSRGVGCVRLSGHTHGSESPETWHGLEGTQMILSFSHTRVPPKLSDLK